MKYKYNVVSYRGKDVIHIENKLKAESGNNEIPERSVEFTVEHKKSKRVSQCYLTHEEAEKLKNDSKVLDVELDISQRDDVVCNPRATQNHNFSRTIVGYSSSLELTNYGLIRHTTREDFLTDTASDTYTHNNTGHGVDIFIIDTGVQADHPDFLDEYGNSRVQKIDWTPYFENGTSWLDLQSTRDFRRNLLKSDDFYIEDEFFHGTQSASVSAGLRYGYAKNAHIYSCKAQLGTANGQYPDPINWFSAIKNFIESRRAQGIDRVAVVNCSFGYDLTGYDLDEVLGGSYADENTARATWSRGNQTDNELINNYRLTPSGTLGAKLNALDALVEELIDIGCHITTAAGNMGIRQVKPDNPEYDNYVTVQRENGDIVNLYHNRPGTPFATDALNCGAIHNNIDSTTGKEKIAIYSNRGNAIDIMAVADFSMCACSNLCTVGSNLRAHPEYPNEKIIAYSGTSCAAPQTAGVVALYASQQPHLSPAALKEIIIEQSTKDIILSTGGYTDNNSFLDTPNRLLYSKFNQNSTFTINNSASIKSVNLGTPYILKTQYKPEALTFGGRGVLPKGVAENYGVSSSFQNVDANMLYNNFKLKHLIFESFADKITVELGLNGNPNNINAHNWIALELYNKQNKVLVKLSRHNADFDPVKQTFYWESFDYDDASTQGIFDYSGFTNNVIGII